MHDRRQPMRDDNHRGTLEAFLDRLGNLGVHPVYQLTVNRSSRIIAPDALKVHRRGRLVHDENPAPLQQSSREAEQLPLPVTEVAALDSDKRVEIRERIVQQILVCGLMSRNKMHLA